MCRVCGCIKKKKKKKKLLQSWLRNCFPPILPYNEKFARSKFIAIQISFNQGCGFAFLQSRLTTRSLFRGDEQFKNLNIGGGGGFGASTSHAWDFTQEDELSSWLQFPIDDLEGDIYSRVLFSPPTVPHHETTEELFRPPISPHSPYTPFVPYRPPFGLSPFTSSIGAAGPSTICSTDLQGIAAVAPKFHRFLNYCWVPKAIMEQKSISPGASTASGSVEGTTPPVLHKPTLSKAEGPEGKRREGKLHANDCQNDDDVDLRSGDVRKKSRKLPTVKRGRAAEVHNHSERRRRDKISVKLRTLQELIPNSNKKDISSTLDEAIKYTKSLQLQVKILNMGSGGMMFPVTQEQYIEAMGMGMAMMGMGMNMRAMNQLMMQYPTQPGAVALSFPMPPFPMQPVPVPPTTARSPPELSSLPMQQGPNQPRLSNPSVVDPYQQPQLPTRSFFQSRAVVRPTTTVPSSSSVDALNPEKQKTG